MRPQISAVVRWPSSAWQVPEAAVADIAQLQARRSSRHWTVLLCFGIWLASSTRPPLYRSRHRHVGSCRWERIARRFRFMASSGRSSLNPMSGLRPIHDRQRGERRRPRPLSGILRCGSPPVGYCLSAGGSPKRARRANGAQDRHARGLLIASGRVSSVLSRLSLRLP
jgi:hypothetical protein